MKRNAFSLIELLVVVAIIGILSVILVPNVRTQLTKAKVAKTKALIANLEVSIEIYKNDFGKYPESYDPQKLYLALVEEAKTPIDVDSDDVKLFPYSSGSEEIRNYWQNDRNLLGDLNERNLQTSGVPASSLVAQEEGYVFVDAWDNPIYYIRSNDYNPGGRTDFRRRGNSRTTTNAPAAYDMRDGSRYKPYNPTSFQLISFGPDQRTISGGDEGGIGSLLPDDRRDNDGDDYIDKEDQVRGDPTGDTPDATAEDDITNF